MCSFRWVAIFLPLAALLGCTSQQAPPTAQYDATIRWTSHGIPHISADSWRSAGYGFAYAVANDAICVLAEEFTTVRGERARYLGDSLRNIRSDAFHKALLDDRKVAGFWAEGYRESREMTEGYVDGYNRYLADHAGTLPDECNDAAWVKPIDLDDVTRLGIGVGIRYGLGRFMTAITDVGEGNRTAAISSPAGLTEQGSNALAFGSALTENGSGILFGNPHYPWHGGSRFHLAHVTIPGQTDVMGVGLITTPRIAIGFNRHVAWTHTVSTALRFTLFRLDLTEHDRMTYLLGDQKRRIEPINVTVEATDADGNVRQVPRTIYMTHLGPVLVTEDMPWTDAHVYVLRDVNYENDRGGDQYYELGNAESVEQIRASLARHQGVSFVNTIAADRHGKALYADVSAIPYVTSEQIDECETGPSHLGPWRVIVLDGSRPECDWQTDDTAAAAGLMPPSGQPSLITDRYVGNSNDSHWLSSPDERLEGYSPIIGDEKTPRSLRTRAGLVFVEEVLERGDRFTPRIVQNILFSHRHYGAELLLDDILAICNASEKTLDIAAGCGILADWDRRQGTDSVGAQIYNEFWYAAAPRIYDHFAVPFDPADPVHTPRGLTIDKPGTQALVMSSLDAALKALSSADVSPLSTWGEAQFAIRNGERIGIPGGNGAAGMYSVISARLDAETHGYNPIIAGNSYIQVVTWNPDGTPDAKAILTYSQSPNPASPFYADQTRLYSAGRWIDLPFTDEEIEADLVRELHLTAP